MSFTWGSWWNQNATGNAHSSVALICSCPVIVWNVPECLIFLDCVLPKGTKSSYAAKIVQIFTLETLNWSYKKVSSLLRVKYNFKTKITFVNVIFCMVSVSNCKECKLRDPSNISMLLLPFRETQSVYANIIFRWWTAKRRISVCYINISAFYLGRIL